MDDTNPLEVLAVANSTEQLHLLTSVFDQMYAVVSPKQVIIAQCSSGHCRALFGAICGLMGLFFVCVWLILHLGSCRVYRGNSKYASARRASVSILTLVDAIALSAVLTFAFPEYGAFIDLIVKYMEGLAVFSFFRIIVYVLGGEQVCVSEMHYREPPVCKAAISTLALKPMNGEPEGDTCEHCVKKMRTIRILIAQMTPTRTLLGVAYACVEFLTPQKSRAGRWGTFLLAILIMASFIMSMWALAYFARMNRHALQRLKKTTRLGVMFGLIKGFLFLSIFQNFIAKILVRMGFGFTGWAELGSNPQEKLVQLMSVIAMGECLVFAVAFRIVFDPQRESSRALRRAREKYEHLLCHDRELDHDHHDKFLPATPSQARNLEPPIIDEVTNCAKDECGGNPSVKSHIILCLEEAFAPFVYMRRPISVNGDRWKKRSDGIACCKVMP